MFLDILGFPETADMYDNCVIWDDRTIFFFEINVEDYTI